MWDLAYRRLFTPHPFLFETLYLSVAVNMAHRATVTVLLPQLLRWKQDRDREDRQTLGILGTSLTASALSSLSPGFVANLIWQATVSFFFFTSSLHWHCEWKQKGHLVCTEDTRNRWRVAWQNLNVSLKHFRSVVNKCVNYEARTAISQPSVLGVLIVRFLRKGKM